MHHIKHNTRIINVTNENSRQRIDNFLFGILKNIPKSMIYRLLRNGEIRINKKRIKPKYKLHNLDIIRIPPIYQQVSSDIPFSTSFYKIKQLKKSIIYEDSYIIILNKPAGTAVHGGSGLCFGIIEGLRALRSDIHFLGLVHRLDIDTSGILLIAKKYSVLRNLHQQFREKKIKKKYLALLYGQPVDKVKTITVPLVKCINNSGQRIVHVSKNGKYSETYFEIKEKFKIASLVKIIPITGRTHQIRVHAQYIGHPIACDNRYGNNIFNQQINNIGVNRLFLHAAAINFIHPQTKKYFYIKAPMENSLKNCITFLRKHNNIINI